jgi:hypothetical protein
MLVIQKMAKPTSIYKQSSIFAWTGSVSHGCWARMDAGAALATPKRSVAALANPKSTLRMMKEPSPD